MQRRQIINQLREEGVALSVTKFKGVLQRLGFPLSGDYDFDDDQVTEIKATVWGDRVAPSQGQEKASTINFEHTYEKAEGAISTALERRVSAIGGGLQSFDAKLADFEERAATAVVARLNTSQARIMALVERKLTEQNSSVSTESGLNLDLLVEEALGSAPLGFSEPAWLLAEAVARASL